MVGEYVLKKNGIDPRKDTNLIQNIEFANIANAFASGTGEFVQLFEPTASIFEKKVKVISSLHSEMNRYCSLYNIHGKRKFLKER